ncbi:imidazole glycerol phosphate synthase subunit HisH [Anaerofustis stercorihominis]|uniref:imidazole glycerol phosphate synthase subunit HisH n=1 Tax=Anaerofustis stercorihominis TaxID=214853 RepID=UPI00214C108D|nr:imidazole glycerol phosphate synthase subunit HisH [Anaerofustis stercorihominis]MCR2032053.1 imidazole glycerol phosphate synthase subunit HisH [Anaerofustis stercorihominis]
MIGIIDYGAGNLRNVYNALNRLGFESVITNDINVLRTCEKLIIPGVGAFEDGMKGLRENDLVPFLKDWVKDGKYLLGICLGMQLLFDKSYEMGEHEGLGFIKGDVVPFDIPKSYKVPHMGWNELAINRADNIVKDITNGEYVYFVHSYHADNMNDEDLIAYSEYHYNVPAVVRHGNVIGMQFHPEKSDKTGTKLLLNYLGE